MIRYQGRCQRDNQGRCQRDNQGRCQHVNKGARTHRHSGRGVGREGLEGGEVGVVLATQLVRVPITGAVQATAAAQRKRDRC